MKTRVLLLVCLLACWTVAGYAAGDKKPKDMRILYLAGNSDWNADAVEKSVIEENVAQRKEAFGGLLRKYFGEVTVMDAADYSPELSEGYDVTIFDGLPPALEPRREEHDPATGKTKYIPARYLPDDFDAPCVTIGVVSAQIGERIGVKNDWFCLCLDACAHHLREGHPIFHGPFKVSLTFEEQPTPDDAFYYQHQFDEPIPKSLPMWRVQTKGYRTDMRFNMGLVSHPWGYEDSPEAEYISGGVSTKSPDAVAIGRHGNFLHWGFIASPLYMTEEAKVVFANAVAYIAQFRGPILARRFDGYMPTRTTVKDKKYLASPEAYHDEMKFMNNMKHLQDSLYGALTERQAKGEKLGAQEEVFLKGYQPMEVQMPPFEAYLQGKADPELFAQFGTDVEAYARYYDENAPYFYGGGGSLVLDEDAKAWGIPNNDKRLLDKAIGCLEEGVETERAQRVLSRYTLCAFATPAEWRKWYDRHEDKLFFTESGGWFFMVDGSRLTPGNDYSVLEWREVPGMEAPASRPVAKEAEEPTADEPVRVAVTGKAAGEGLVEVTVRFALYKGFHVYREVGAGDPYIPLEVEFLLPEGCALEGGLKMPAPKPFSKTGTTVYEGKVEFTQLVRCGQQPEAIRVKLSYQCCDSNICLPPKEEVMEVRMQ